MPKAGVRASRAKPGDTVFARSDPSIAVRSRSRPSALVPARAVPGRQAQETEAVARHPPVVGEVVERQDDGHLREEGVTGGVAAGALEQRRARVPVVDVEHVERGAVATERGQRDAAQDGEPPRVVRVVVEGVAVERRRARPPGATGSRPPRRSPPGRGRLPVRGFGDHERPLRHGAGGTSTDRYRGRNTSTGAGARRRPPAGGRAPGRAHPPRPRARRSWPRARTPRRAARHESPSGKGTAGGGRGGAPRATGRAPNSSDVRPADRSGRS